jgi:hypothetical protein
MAFHRRDTVRTNDDNRRVNMQRGVVRILSVLVHRLLNPVGSAAFTMGRPRGGPSWTGDRKEHISQLILEELPPFIRQRMKRNLSRDLSKAGRSNCSISSSMQTLS